MPPIRAAKSAMRPPKTGVRSSALFVMWSAYQSLRAESKNVACTGHHWTSDTEGLLGSYGSTQK